MSPAAASMDASLDFTVTVAIEKDATYLTIPGSRGLLGTGRAVKVEGTLDGHPFAATLMPSGDGLHWLPLRRALTVTLDKDATGEEVTVHLQRRLS